VFFSVKILDYYNITVYSLVCNKLSYHWSSLQTVRSHNSVLRLRIKSQLPVIIIS